MPNVKTEIKYSVPEELKPYTTAIQKASGLSEFDAITSALFAIATHLDLEEYPILVYLGVAGSGKSSAMKQLFPMCKESKWIAGGTEAAQRKNLQGVRTAFLEEADHNLSTDLYTRRFSKQTGKIEVNVATRPAQWELQSIDIFGATVMHRRVALDDVGLRSRSIIIRTKYKMDTYEIAKLGDVSAIAAKVAGGVKRRIKEIGGIDRVQQTWNPVYVIAEQLGLTTWINEVSKVIEKEITNLRGGQGYEPSEAILQAIGILARDVMGKRTDKSIRISEIVRVLKDEFALSLKHTQIKEEAEARGFETGMLQGYPIVKAKKDLLDALLPEAG